MNLFTKQQSNKGKTNVWLQRRKGARGEINWEFGISRQMPKKNKQGPTVQHMGNHIPYPVINKKEYEKKYIYIYESLAIYQKLIVF